MNRLVEQAQRGDSAALCALWDQVERFALAVSRRYIPTAYADADDFAQCAYLGFHRAMSVHDGRYDFLSLIRWCIQRECRAMLGLRKKDRPFILPLDALADDGETPYVELLEDESIPPSGAAMEEDDLNRDIRAAVDALPEREKRVVDLHFFEELPLSSVAERLQFSAERARQIKDNALARLRCDPVISASYAPDFRTMPVNGGLRRFNHSRTSSTEAAAMQRISLQRRMAREEMAKYRRWMVLDVAEGLRTQEEADAFLAQKRIALGL